MLAALAFLGAACSRNPETSVVALGESAEAPVETVERAKPDSPPSTAPVEEVSKQNAEPVITIPDDVDERSVGDGPPLPPPEVDRAWADKPLASSVLTEDDLVAVGLGAGWTTSSVEWVDDLISAQTSDETICGRLAPLPNPHIAAGHVNARTRSWFDFVAMPASDGPYGATDFVEAFELMATCPDLEEDFERMSMALIDIDIDGADESVVLYGSYAGGSILESVIVAAAVVDDQLFLAYLVREGVPVATDAEFTSAALELSISRL